MNPPYIVFPFEHLIVTERRSMFPYAVEVFHYGIHNSAETFGKPITLVAVLRGVTPPVLQKQHRRTR